MLWPEAGTEPERIAFLNQEPPRKEAAYILYWMQASQRARHNPALEAFMLEGLAETAQALADRGIRFVLRRGEPPDVALPLAANAGLIVCDRGYLRHPVAWGARDMPAAGSCRWKARSSVDTASPKAEIGARTLRPRIGRQLERFLHSLPPRSAKRDASRLGLRSDLDLGADPTAGPKMLVWSRSPESACDTVLGLDNRHLLDGRDPNSYANVGWIFACTIAAGRNGRFSARCAA